MTSISALFRDGDTVFRRATRELGRVEGNPVLDGGEYWYRVRFERGVRKFPEEELEALVGEDESIRGLMEAGKWGRLEAFRRAMAVERISHENRNTVYAFNAHRILFQPYQYKPLLKVLDSPDRRLLIADEVGLGKTIEAGLILAELEARERVERVLVVCPSRLREKWRNELNRKFRQDFDILDRRGLQSYIQRNTEDESRGRLRGIVSVQTLRADDLRESLHAQVGMLDLVIVDEAHHARNPGSQTSGLLRDLGQLSRAMVLLTATPLHLGMRDLHTLLHALRPSEFPDAMVFESTLESHRGVLHAEAVARARSEANLPLACKALREVFYSNVLPGMRDPLAVDVIDDLERSPPRTPRDWLTVERRIQELHPLASVLTRTRKRDVEEKAPTRRAKVLYCQLTEDERRLYRQLVGGSDGLGWIGRPMSLGAIQRARQAASCLPAALEHYELHDELADEDELSDISAEDIEGGGADAEDVLGAPPRKASSDSKFQRLLEIMRLIDAEDPGAKVLVFSFFVGTTRYLEEGLTAQGYPAVRIAGDVRSDPQRPERDERGRRVAQFQDDPHVRVMVSSEVGSEGLDFQFAHHVVNYDLPWNPMVVEQRIGRIDRFGQKSPVVNIWNLVVEGTVEDRILHRLYQRIGIFERSVGQLEAILGDAMRQLCREYVSGRLTQAEADLRVEQAARAVRERELDLEKLEARASELFGHEEYIKEQMARVRRLGRFVSEGAILSLVRGYLEARHPDTGLWDVSRGMHGLRLTPRLRDELQDAALGTRTWVPLRRGDEMLFTTDGQIAFDRQDVELINVSHPLLRAAVQAVQEQLGAPSARVGQAVLELEGPEDQIEPGLYYVVVYALEITGIRSRRILEAVAYPADSEVPLGSELAERLLFLVTEQGREWDEHAGAPGCAEDLVERFESDSRAWQRRLREAETKESEARYLRRRQTVELESQQRRATIEQKIQTAQSRDREARIIKMFEAQLAKQDAEHRRRVAELDEGRKPSFELSEPIAVCAVRVVRRR